MPFPKFRPKHSEFPTKKELVTYAREVDSYIFRAKIILVTLGIRRAEHPPTLDTHIPNLYETHQMWRKACEIAQELSKWERALNDAIICKNTEELVEE